MKEVVVGKVSGKNRVVKTYHNGEDNEKWKYSFEHLDKLYKFELKYIE